MTERKSYYITTPIYYVNDAPHIGHAYTSIACDVLARFKRLDGYRVWFLTGTDEHGQKVEKSASAAGIPPQTLADRVSERFRQLHTVLGLSNDDFIRTTQDRHKRACAALWRRLVDRGQIYLGRYAGWYAVRDEAYYEESELQEDARGNRIAPSGAPVSWVVEPAYFFRLSAWQDRLLELYADRPDFVRPAARRNEAVSFVRGGLRDIAISRSALSWGIEIPDDPSHRMYVWLDALTNYLSGIGFPDTESALWKRFWPVDLHVVGKDILRFHVVYWPAFLMAAGLPVPRGVFAHGWWTIEGRKMSKSMGNTMDPFFFAHEYGRDALRYFLLRETPFGGDGDFSLNAFMRRVNHDLANQFGNLVQRTLSLIARTCDGKLPPAGILGDAEGELREMTENLLSSTRRKMDTQAFSHALADLLEVVSKANSYIDGKAPWRLARENPQQMHTVLYTLAETIRQLAILFLPFIPDACAKILDQLAVPESEQSFSAFSKSLVPGIRLPSPSPVFPRLHHKTS